MTEILFENGAAISLGAINKEEDLKQPGRIHINAPPDDCRCDVCGKHISELEPFGGPGDPLVGDFNGELLVKRWRPCGPYSEEAEKAYDKWEEAKKQTPDLKDEDPELWFIAEYGEKKGKELYYGQMAWESPAPSWECRDCAGLDTNEYFEVICKRWKENGDKQLAEPHKQC